MTWGHEIEGLPWWVDSARYEIDARAGGAGHEQMRAMMRTLLAGRFKLVLHREARTLPVFELAAADRGVKISPMPAAGCSTRGADSAPVTFSRPPAAMPNICGAYRRIVVSPAPGLVDGAD